ncbi:MAG: sodium/panthothenate symporter [Isosphaeraceae bacterium]|jgi:SSS family solute:Na+ symporter/sodium/pantothenate symporter|nr:MAG: sodium/panthothenate symporter [Isosphaeraceae bacterium]
MPEAVPAIGPHPATGLALIVFTLVSLGLGVLANRLVAGKGGFLPKYFLGNRSLGAIAVALTAAVMSGGTFMGFPSLVYTHGWVVGLWICSYMVAPLTILGVMGKRIAQLARRTGAITLPDLLRERFGSPALALASSLLIIAFLTINLIPQFKAGAGIVKEVLPAGNSGTEVGGIDTGYLLGLVIFTATVVGYTTYGGFLAAVWTDVFQSLVMLAGVLILLPLALAAAGGLEAATEAGMAQAGTNFAFGPGAGRAFHPLGLAFSFFVMWAISGMGQPSTIVRLMATRDARTLRYSILYLTIYNALIYIPLILIFVAARSILPGLVEARQSDLVMPRLCLKLAHPYLAGLILAAPYGAVMSTVSGFLLIVASGLVRDVYQRFLRPRASERELRWASYGMTAGVGLLVTLAAIRPPEYLQLLIIFASSGLASAFLVPALMSCFWRRATAAGALAAMLAGVATTVGLYLAGYILGVQGIDQGIGPRPSAPAYGPYYLLGLDPCVWGLVVSAVSGVGVSLVTRAPDAMRIARLFDRPMPPALVRAAGVWQPDGSLTDGDTAERSGSDRRGSE